MGTMEDASLVLKKCGPFSNGCDLINLDGGDDGKEVIVGRCVPSTYIILSKCVSKMHAAFTLRNKTWVLKDLKSVNGTYVNAMKLDVLDNFVLSIGDEVGFGTPVRFKNDDRGIVYCVCKSESHPAKPVKQELLFEGEAMPRTSYSMEAMPCTSNSVEAKPCTSKNVEAKPVSSASTIHEKPYSRLLIKLARCDSTDFPLTTGVRWNQQSQLMSDSDSSDSDCVKRFFRRRKRCRVVSDNSDSESELPSQAIKQKIKVVTPVKPCHNADVLLVDLCSEDEDIKQDNVKSFSVPDGLTTVSGTIAVPKAPEMLESEEEQVVNSYEIREKELNGYSQEDDVILISDDEDDEPVVYKRDIKEEFNEVDEDWAMNFRKEINIGLISENNDEECEVLSGPLDLSNAMHARDYVNRDFIDKDAGTTDHAEAAVMPPQEEAENIGAANNDAEANLVSTNELEPHFSDFFPILSQAFDDSENEDANEHTGNECGVSAENSTSSFSRKSFYVDSTSSVQKKSAIVDRLKNSGQSGLLSGPGTALLTQAKPLNTGRRSWKSISERNSERNGLQMQERRRSTPCQNNATSRGKKQSLKSVLLNQLGHRVRVAGGGSDGRKTASASLNINFMAGSSGISDRASVCESVCKSVEKEVPVPHKALKKARGDYLKETMLIPPVCPRPRQRNSSSAIQNLTSSSTSSVSTTKSNQHSSSTCAVPTIKLKQHSSSTCAVPTIKPKQPSSSASSGHLTSTIVLNSTQPVASKLSSLPPTTVKPTNNCSSSNATSTIVEKSVKQLRFSNDVGVRFIDSNEEKLQKTCHQETVQSSMSVMPPSVFALGVIKEMLSWNSTWFSERKNLNICRAPPDVSKRATISVKHIYNSQEEFTKIYRPLMLLETWEDMAHSYAMDDPTLFKMEYVSYAEVDKSSMLTFNVVVPKHVEDCEQFPHEGWVGELKIPLQLGGINGMKRQCGSMLARVNAVKKIPYVQFKKSQAPTRLMEHLASGQYGEKVVLVIVLMTKLMSREIHPLNFKTEDVFTFRLISKLRIQPFEAVASFAKTLLGRALLHPRIELCTLPPIDPNMHLMNGCNIAFNEEQEHAIMRVTVACVMNPSAPTVAMIHGPPGTGKTAVISGLIAQLLYGDHVTPETRPLILLCAHSNNAVDENVKRLRNCKRQGILKALGGINIVRMGQSSSTCAEVQKYHVDNLVKTNIQIRDEEYTKQECEIEKRRSHLVVLHRSRQEAQNARSLDEVAKLRKEIGLREVRLARMEKIFSATFGRMTTENVHVRFTKTREEILVKANVIATTLGSCYQGGMDVFCRGHNRQVICIVDEATQCVEPDLLVLLRFGITKLVLVGDPHQLPATVRSTEAKNLGYSRSLFERLYKHFKDRIPIITLKTQYRMHPEICSFPSKAFYKNELRTDAALALKMSNSPLAQYTFFDIIDSHEEQEKQNPNEVVFITRLVEVILEQNHGFEIGIITFYNTQKNLLKIAVQQSSKIKTFDRGGLVEVNTVDGFQGREKDVIIVSTVRARCKTKTIGFLMSPRRLNVSITRARNALYVCGHANSLKVSDDWHGMIVDATKRQKLQTVTSKAAVQGILDIITNSGN